MKKAVIIDDEPLAREIVKDYLADYPIEIAAECNNGFEGIKAIQQLSPDLIFLDIQMPKINGFEMLELIDNPPAIIFTTAFDEYAIRAFEQNTIDYLLKPFDRVRFDKAVRKFLEGGNGSSLNVLKNVVEDAPKPQNRIVVKDKNDIRIIPVSKIQYMEAADDYIKVHSEEGTYLKKQTMAYYEKSLSGHQFIRCHRSYLINVRLITRIPSYGKDNHTVILTGGEELPVSQTGYLKLKENLGI